MKKIVLILVLMIFSYNFTTVEAKKSSISSSKSYASKSYKKDTEIHTDTSKSTNSGPGFWTGLFVGGLLFGSNNSNDSNTNTNTFTGKDSNQGKTNYYQITEEGQNSLQQFSSAFLDSLFSFFLKSIPIILLFPVIVFIYNFTTKLYGNLPKRR